MSVPPERCTALGTEGEYVVARVMGGYVTAPSHPIDVITPTQAIEVKTLVADALEYRVSMGRKARRIKKAWAKDHGKEPLTVLVVVHPNQYDLYIGQGFKGFPVRTMAPMGSLTRPE